MIKKTILALATACLLMLGAGCTAVIGSTPAASPAPQVATAPKTIIHVVTVSWKADATPAQIQAALDGVQALPSKYPGITRVWTRTLSAQGDRSHAFVMEFANEQAFRNYTDSPAQLEWYKVYLPAREASTTFDITN